MPIRIPRRHVLARQIRILMTIAALERVEPLAVWPAPHILRMHVAVVALQRCVAIAVAVHATEPPAIVS